MKTRMLTKQMSMGLKLFCRNPTGVFWTITFPVVMLVAFGFIFRGGPSPALQIPWSMDGSETPADVVFRKALADQNVMVQEVTPGEGDSRWQEGKAPILLEGRDGNYKLRVNSYAAIQGMQSLALVQQAYASAQCRILGLAEPKHIPYEVMSPGKRKTHNYVEFLLPGLMGFNLLIMGIFTVGMVHLNNREKRIYRRLAVTPLPKSIFLGAQIMNRMLIGLVQVVILLGVGVVLFHVHNQGSYLQVLILLLAGMACFMAMGYALASLANSAEAYSGWANLAFIPMILLSGVYFSLDSAPKWLQTAVQLLPLTPLLKVLRAVFNDGGSMFHYGGSLAIIAGWIALLFAVAVKRFKWA
jgi:ABC-type multidrug transport system permease subunit